MLLPTNAREATLESGGHLSPEAMLSQVYLTKSLANICLPALCRDARDGLLHPRNNAM